MLIHYQALKKLLAIFWAEQGMHLRIYISFGLVLLVILFNLLTPWAMKQVVSGVYSDNPSATFIFFLIAYGLFWSLSKITFQIRELICIRVFERGTTKFCLKIFKKLLSLPISFHIKNNTGGMMHSLDAAQNSIYYILYGILFAAIPMFLELILMFSIIAMNYGFFYALLLVIFPLVYIFYSVIMLSSISRQQDQTRIKSKQVASYMNDALLNIENIYYQGAEDEITREFGRIAVEKEESSANTFELLSKVAIGQSIIAGMGLIIIIIIVGLKVLNQQLVPADFILFSGYLIQFITPLNGLCLMFREVLLGLNKIEDVLYILDINDIEENTQKDIKVEDYAISFDKVSFNYPNQTHAVLHDISFNIPTGESIAIVGANGAGKTTLIRLLFKMYTLSSGKISIGDIDIENVPARVIRDKIAVVPQDVLLLDGTIHSNLTLGHKNNLDHNLFRELMEATGVANLVESLPHGYETEVGERGIKLSGGQKKIIGIARALLKKINILVLDEFTASLDLSAEQRIMSYLCNIKNITKIFITHRPDMLNQMDQVLFFLKGQLINHGTHHELMNSCELYSKFWQELK